MTLVYFFLWVTLNGRVTWEVILLGVPVAFGLDCFMQHAGRGGGESGGRGQPLVDGRRTLNVRFPSSLPTLVRLLPGALLYAGTLICAIVKANLGVIRLILAPKIEVEPCLVRVRTKLKTHAARVALANSITLTPGTVTVALEGEELLVHALTREMAEGLADSEFERRLLQMEEPGPRRERPNPAARRERLNVEESAHA